MFCNGTNITSSTPDSNGNAYFFLQRQYQGCNTKYGIFVRSPNRAFQEKMYVVDAGQVVEIAPVPLFSTKLQFVSAAVPISKMEVRLYKSDGVEFFKAKTNGSGEVYFESEDCTKFA